MREGIQEAPVIARMQPDGRLIQNVKHPAQFRTDLRCEANTLGFAAGKRGRRPFQAQVIQPHRRKKLEPPPDLVYDARPAICNSRSANSQLRTVSSARATGSWVNSAMEKFFTRTARLAGRSRLP